MEIASRLCRSALSSVALLAVMSSAFATDYVFSSGTYAPGVTAPQPLLAGDVLQINSASNKFFDTSTFTNQTGLVNWNAGPLYMQNGATVNNQSVWDAQSDDSISYSGGTQPLFNNSGTLRKSAGAGTTTIGNVPFANSGIINAQTGTIAFSGGTTTFNGGTQFTGAGSNLVNSGATFNNAFTSSNLSLAGGSFTGGSAQINGNVNFSGGSLFGTWEVAAGQTLSANAGGNKFLDTAVLTNNGTMQWQTGDTFYMQNSGVLTNNALYDIQASSSITPSGGVLSTFTNSSGGTLRVAATQTGAIGAINFVNNGGTLTANGTLLFNGGNATFNNLTTFNGSGSNLIASSATFNGSISSSNLTLQSGLYTGGPAVLNGNAIFTGGSFMGTWELGAGQVLNGNDGTNKFLDGASFTNKGSVQWQSVNPLYMQNGASFNNQGSLNMLASTAVVYNGGTTPSFTNTGTVSVASGVSGSIGNTIAFVNNGGALASAGTLTFAGGNTRFNAGSSFTGAGLNLVTASASFVDNFSSQNLRLGGGTFTGGDGTPGSKVVASGVVEFTGGYLSGNWELAASQNLNALTGTNKFMDTLQFTNKGAINWQTADALYLEFGAVLDNQGLFNMQTGALLAYNGGSGPTFTNSGTLRVAASQSSTIGGFAFVNNAGTLDVGAGGALNFNGGLATFNGGTQFTGSGVTMVTANASFNGSFNSSNLSLRSGLFLGSSATLGGSAEFRGGTMQGGWTVAGGATLNGVSGINKFLDNITLTNLGTITWQTSDPFYFQNAANLSNQGTMSLQADSTMVYNGGTIGTFTNTGLITKAAGSGTWTIGNSLGFNNLGTINVSSGTIALPTGFTNNGTLKGTGTFSTNVLTNAGHIAPGASPGTLNLTGNYVQAAAGFLDAEVASTGLADKFAISGTASLAGTLALTCVSPCALNNGDLIVLLQSAPGFLSGTFTSTTYASFGFGFQGTIIYDYVAGQVKLSVIQAGTFPDLTIAKSHTGDFALGQPGATYAITVTNSGLGPTSGTVTVTETVPTGLTAVSMLGTGWICTQPAGPCTRSDVLQPNTPYPAITLTVNVNGNATSPQINNVAVALSTLEPNTGNNGATDSTVIVVPPDLTITKTHAGNFSQGQTGVTYTATVTNSGAGPKVAGSLVSVVDTPPSGLTVTAMSGAGWTCTVLPTCSRTDVLAVGQSYPPVTITASVAGNATSPQINSVAVTTASYESNTGNNGATDTTVIIVPPDLVITKSHVGNFAQGQVGATYTSTVTNSGTGPKTAGSLVTLIDTPPSGLTVTAMSGTGWTCPVLPTCTRSDVLAAGQSYPAVTITVTVGGAASSPQVNSVAVTTASFESNSGNNGANDSTTIVTLPVHPLTVTKSGSGSGTVASLDGGISCGANCSRSYVDTSVISLAATPSGGSVFTGWLGACTGTGACVVTIGGAANVSATFALAPIGTHILDIDVNTAYDTQTDGLMVMRYLFGLRGASVTTGALGASPGQSDPVQISIYLNDILPYLDVDGNGAVDALTDGLLIVRNLLGLTGTALTQGAIGAGAIRTTAADVQNYLTTLKQ